MKKVRKRNQKKTKNWFFGSIHIAKFQQGRNRLEISPKGIPFASFEPQWFPLPLLCQWICNIQPIEQNNLLLHSGLLHWQLGLLEELQGVARQVQQLELARDDPRMKKKYVKTHRDATLVWNQRYCYLQFFCLKQTSNATRKSQKQTGPNWNIMQVNIKTGICNLASRKMIWIFLGHICFSLLSKICR